VNLLFNALTSPSADSTPLSRSSPPLTIPLTTRSRVRKVNVCGPVLGGLASDHSIDNALNDSSPAGSMLVETLNDAETPVHHVIDTLSTTSPAQLSFSTVDTHTSTPSDLSDLTLSPPTSPTPPISIVCCQRSSTSSDEYRVVSFMPNMSSTATSTAVLSLNNGKRPMISAGAMTLELLHCFEHHARGYLLSKDGLEAKNFVEHIIYSFEDPLFSDWYQSQQELLSILSFAEFMVKVHARWLPKRWQQELARKVWLTKQGKTAFSEFVNSLRRDNLLLKGSQFHLSPSQLRTQIESNIAPELAAAFDRWKDNHESSNDESEKENDALVEPLTAAAAELVKATSDALKAETKLQSFVDMLTKLDQKLIEDRNARKRDAEDAARSLKRSGLSVGLSDAS
jgi:hypothetical protein